MVDQHRELAPDDMWALDKKKSLLTGWLAHTIHQWPSGVLYDSDGATAIQCEEILAAASELLELDQNSDYAELCKGVRCKTMLYRHRLNKA